MGEIRVQKSIRKRRSSIQAPPIEVKLDQTGLFVSATQGPLSKPASKQLSNKSTLSVSPKSKLNTTLKLALKSILGDHYQYVLITNKYLKRQSKNGFFALRVNRRGIQFLNKKSVQKTEYSYSFSSGQLLMNGNYVGQEFQAELAQKMCHCLGQVKIKKAEIIGKKKEGQ